MIGRKKKGDSVILLDTCTLLWLAADQEKLSRGTIKAIMANAGELFVSSITAFEIGIKVKRGRLELPLGVPEWYEGALRHHGIREIPINGAIAVQAVALPPLQ
jgi:PIN domain nuclease of toxin-antitoxin system